MHIKREKLGKSFTVGYTQGRVPWGEHSAPCRTTQESSKASHRKRKKGNCGPEPLSSFPWEGAGVMKSRPGVACLNTVTRGREAGPRCLVPGPGVSRGGE